MYRRSWHSDHIQDGGKPVQVRQHRVQHVRLHPDEQPSWRGDRHGHGYEAQCEGDAPSVHDPGRRGRPDGGHLRRGRRGAGRGARLVRPGRIRGGHVHPLRPDDPHRRPDDHVRQPGGCRRLPRLRPQAGVSVARALGREIAWQGGDTVYEKNGEKYFVVDGHMHYWNAAPDNWVPGAEQYAKGWIECFHAYMGLAPPETHWPLEKFQKYSEDDLMKDVFIDGHVDVAIFQPTYLKEWYKEGFNTTERNATMGEKHPGKFVNNTRWDPRDGDEGLKTLQHNVERFGSKGVKLYTAEWNAGSRGWKLTDPAAYRYLEACQELGIKNIHAHKGPTIWPLDKDGFDVMDVDQAASDFPDLNFIVEHVGLPRIEDFCFMATQEPNVYAGLSVVIGALMHARPRFFAKVMGELLFWVGEDKMTFGSDYGIWEPKWQVEGFVDWEMPNDAEFSDYPRLTAVGKKKILGLNAAKLYGIQVPAEFRVPAQAGTPAARDDAQLVDDKSQPVAGT